MLILYECNLTAQEIGVSAVFDTSNILIGDQINFNIVIEQPANVKLLLPYFKDTVIKNIEIISGPVIDTVEIPDNKMKITEKYLITSFDSGSYVVDPVFAEIRDESGLKRFYSDYAYLKVNRVDMTPPDSTAKFFDIVRPYKAPLTAGEILPWIFLSIIALFVIWYLIQLYKRLKKAKEELGPPKITEPAHIIAFRELEKLKEAKLWQKGEIKKYYTILTEILRSYLENRFAVFSMEMTTSETLEELVRTGFRKNESYNKLKSVLNGADLVKFAKYKPEPSENELNYELSWDFISATKSEESIVTPVNNSGKEDKT